METQNYNREKFEEYVFRDYYVKSIQRNPNVPQPAISGALNFVATATLNKSELCERDGDNYIRQDVSAMWHGWKLHHELVEYQKQKELKKNV